MDQELVSVSKTQHHLMSLELALHNYSIVEGGELALVCSASPHANPIWRKKVNRSILTLIVVPQLQHCGVRRVGPGLLCFPSSQPHLEEKGKEGAMLTLIVSPHNYSIVEGGELALVCSASPHLNPIWRKKVRGSMLTLIVGPTTTALWREESWLWSALLPLISTPSGGKR
jgi:hypothetical protein